MSALPHSPRIDPRRARERAHEPEVIERLASLDPGVVDKLADLPEASLRNLAQLDDAALEVRAIAIDTLGRLYRRTADHVDRALLELVFLRLGDEHSLVRQSVRRLIRVLAPPDEVLLQS